MKRHKTDSVTVCFPCPSDLAQEIAKQAKADDSTRSHLIRRLLRKALAQSAKASART